jgi:AcrR family transcriptional regulator
VVVEPGAVVGLGALAVLTEQGYERMTVDIVPARAKTARAMVYRRWATKADLVTWIIDVANAC